MARRRKISWLAKQIPKRREGYNPKPSKKITWASPNKPRAGDRSWY